MKQNALRLQRFPGQTFCGNEPTTHRVITTRSEHAVYSHRLAHRFAITVRKGAVLIDRKAELRVALLE